MADWTFTSPTGVQNIDALIGSQKWSDGPVAYNFPINASYFPPDYLAGHPYSNGWDLGTFQPATDAVIEAVNYVLDHQFSAVTNLSFVSTAPSASADMSIAFVQFQDNFGGAGFWPWMNQVSGDVWFNAQYRESQYSDFGIGSNPWATVIHEIGHAVGLQHGHASEGVIGGTLETSSDSVEYSIMTYRTYVGATTDTSNFSDINWNSWPQSLMMYDIAALQSMYGASYSYNAGDTVYSFSPITGEYFIDGVSHGVPDENVIFRTIWDGNGTDTYDLSNYSSSVDINLAPGEFSDFGADQKALLSTSQGITARGNVFNALLHGNNTGSLIENAIGGTGDDRFSGNQASNFIDGGAGSDVMVYDGQIADYKIEKSGNRVYVTVDQDDIDTLVNIEVLQFANASVATSNLADSTDLPIDSLFAAYPDIARGLAAAYEVLLAGVPNEAGFTFLINNAVSTNFGAGPGPTFNQENIFINLTNNLAQGNAAAKAQFDALATGPTLQEKVTSIYGALTPASKQSPEGLAFLTRDEGLTFYQDVAAERGVAGTDGAAIVALASLLKIAVTGDYGIGNAVNDLIKAVAAGSDALPATGTTLTALEIADGTAFDADDAAALAAPLASSASFVGLADGHDGSVEPVALAGIVSIDDGMIDIIA